MFSTPTQGQPSLLCRETMFPEQVPTCRRAGAQGPTPCDWDSVSHSDASQAGVV